MAGTVVSLVIAGCAVLAAAAGFLALREAGPLVAAQIAACLGALLGLVWVLVPVVVASEDQTLDPELLSPIRCGCATSCWRRWPRASWGCWVR